MKVVFTVNLIKLAPIQLKQDEVVKLAKLRDEKVKECIAKMGTKYLLHKNNWVKHVSKKRVHINLIQPAKKLRLA